MKNQLRSSRLTHTNRKSEKTKKTTVLLSLLSVSLFVLFSLSSRQARAQINFAYVSGTPFPGLQFASTAFADIDGDGDLDLLITGDTSNSSLSPVTRLYKNDGNGNFTLVPNTPFTNVAYGKVAFADVDGDGDMDVLIDGLKTGSSPLTDRVAELYLNDGNGNFTLDTNDSIAGFIDGDMAFADVDGDGDMDLLIMGDGVNNQYITKLYKNDGSGNFTEVTGTPFTAVANGGLAFADVDGDGDSDVVIVGQESPGGVKSAKLYKNDGSGNFTEVTNAGLVGTVNGSVAFGDIDGDGDEDLIITGINTTPSVLPIIYKNDGSGNFTAVTWAAGPMLTYSSCALFDADGDGDLDLMMDGFSITTNETATLFSNGGSGNYTAVAGMPFVGTTESSMSAADIDGDGDKDILITGNATAYGPSTRLYRNNTCFPPMPDTATLDTVRADCKVGDLTAPTASSNCIAGNIVGTTTTTFPITSPDTTFVTWTYNDGIGHTSTQTQVVIIGIDTGVTLINGGTALKAEASGNYTYQWLDCDQNETPVPGATSQTFSPTTSGSYAVAITSQEGCSDTSACVSITGTGIAPLTTGQWQVYPNPTKGIVTIRPVNDVTNFPIRVYSSIGQLISTKIYSGKEIKIDLTSYPSGIYNVILNNGYSIKIIKY